MTPRRIFSAVAVTAMVGGGLMIPQGAQAGPAPSGGGGSAPSRARAVRVAPTPTHRSGTPVSLLGGPGVWTKISNGTGSGAYEPGLLRTADGKLHVVWVKQNPAKDYSIGYTTISLTGAVLNTGAALSHWLGLQSTPALLPDGKNIRLVFNGGQDLNNANKFSLGARYTETSTNGTSWTLVHGSLSSHTLFNLNLAATTQVDGTPVSTEGENNELWYHVGVDSNIPSTTADKTISGQIGSGLENAALVRDKDGSIYEAWFQMFESHQGYYVKKILPAPGPTTKAPSSGNENYPSNEPRQKVALAARVGGGVYLAYCQDSKTKACARIVVWKVGSKTPRVVPGSSSGNADHVSLSAGAKGRLVVAWNDRDSKGNDVIRVIRTNTHATAWGVLRTVKSPVVSSDLAYFNGLFAESSSGRIDLIANVRRFSNGAPTAFFHTQVLEGLKVTASPAKVSHLHSATVTFKVTDAGEAVANASVSFAGHKAHTNSAGIAKITVAKGQSKGGHTATASKSLYYKATCQVKVI